MLDKVAEEVGKENVVQVLTNNAANYTAAGELLIQKRNHLCWTPAPFFQNTHSMISISY